MSCWRICALIVAIVGLAAGASAQSGIDASGGNAVPATPSKAKSLEAEVRAAVQEVRAHAEVVQGLVKALSELRKLKPKPPASDAGDAAKKAHQAALAAWASRVSKLEAQLEDANAELAAAEERLHRLTQVVLPSKMKADAEAAHEAAADARASAEQALASSATPPAAKTSVKPDARPAAAPGVPPAAP